jgi:hypothetical protein
MLSYGSRFSAAAAAGAHGAGDDAARTTAAAAAAQVAQARGWRIKVLISVEGM